MKRLFLSLALAALAHAQSAPSNSPAGNVPPEASARMSSLREFNNSLEQVVSRVSPAVVQIQVSGYGKDESHNSGDTVRIVRQHAIGSGVIVDPDGYIMTNAHVVEGAQRVRVIVTLPGSGKAGPLPLRSQQIFSAKILGRHKKSDLALIKIDATHLPAISLRDNLPVRQGQLVFAIGSPEGLRDSVTMGVISAVARQTDTDNPMFYLQTDAPLNPGNSGGPLVDVDGNLVGINTFMLSAGGGSEGLGFAIPAAIVKFDYEHLRKYGQVHRVAIGATAQNITPTLAAGLGLSRSWGVILSNVGSGGFAQMAGLKVGDIITEIDGRPIDSYPSYVEALYLHSSDQVLRIGALRGTTNLTATLPVTVYHDKIDDLTDVPDLQRTFIPELSVFVSDIDDQVKPLLREDDIDSGVVVIAQTAGPNITNVGVEAGDVIRSINRIGMRSVAQLQETVRKFKPGDPVVIQIERGGKLQFLAFEMD
ncbi:MAG TPA: trypsin-like peptidase domain-containing protein [Candidatus Binatia bacterium]|nr:trypsin-like peptidase domain-containing protein [Candidatus Binatia bacterium]